MEGNYSMFPLKIIAMDLKTIVTYLRQKIFQIFQLIVFVFDNSSTEKLAT